MDFSFTDEQRQLRDSISALLRDRYGFDARRNASRSEPGWRPDIWRTLTRELGLGGAAFPERLGGAGGGAAETMIIMEELGSVLALEPWLETIVLAGGLLQACGGAVADAALRDIIAGDAVLAFGWAEPASRYAFSDVVTTARRDGSGWKLDGHKTLVAAAPWAGAIIVAARTGGGVHDRDGISLFIVPVDRPGVTLRAYPTIDGRRSADVLLEGVTLPAEALIGPEGGALPLIEQVGDAGVAALCAEAVGITRRLLSDTIAYTAQRRQFGQPIGGFQALQHRMVDMYQQVEHAASASYLATLHLGSAPHERAKAVSAAKVAIGGVCKFVGQNAVQLHGGMGMTEELPIGHYFKRATVIEGELGSSDWHLRRYDRLARNAA